MLCIHTYTYTSQATPLSVLFTGLGPKCLSSPCSLIVQKSTIGYTLHKRSCTREKLSATYAQSTY